MTNTPQFHSQQIDTDDFVYVILEKDGVPATETIRYDNFVQWLFKPASEQVMALHSAIGVAGEAGELADAIKKEYIYGKPRDLDNIIEELGDLEWYMQSVRNHYGVSRKHVLQCNADKLSKRYVSLRYSDAAAIDRADKKAGPDLSAAEERN